jgi:hypothetical protein
MLILLYITHDVPTIIEAVTNNNNDEDEETVETVKPAANDSVPSGNGSANLGYQNYDNDNNAYILAQKNAANIQYLVERLNNINSLEGELQTLTNNVNINTKSIKQVANVMSQKVGQITGITPSVAKNVAAGNLKSPFPVKSSA